MPRSKTCTALALFTAAAVTIASLTGCSLVGSKKPKIRHANAGSGFLSTYSNLESLDADRAVYATRAIDRYQTIIVEMPRLHFDNKALSEKERRAVAQHMLDATVRVLSETGHGIAYSPGPRIARLRVAITDIDETEFWLNVNPAARVLGISQGGAAIESEIIDSITGEQLAASVYAGRGNQLAFDNLGSTDDAKDVINQWANDFRDRIVQMQRNGGQ